MENSLLKAGRELLLRLNWRRRAKKKHNVGLRISRVADFFQELNAADVPYVVLRWFDEVPLSPAAESGYEEDIDLLMDGLALSEMQSAAFGHHGRIPCDLYTDSGVRGTTYLKMPYYPPAMAVQMLATRVLHNDSFAVPNPEWHLLSLVYHIVYHKGPEAGIPAGIDLPVEPSPKRDYVALLPPIAAAAGRDLPDELTLLNLHEWLKSHHCDMPVDLMARWPKQSDWIKSLIAREMESLRPWAERMPQLFVFLVRDDASGAGLESLIEEQLGAMFAILKSERLNDAQAQRAMHGIRGGNWIEHKRTAIVKPVRVILAYDFAPQPLATSNQKQSDHLYPFVENQNVFIKHEIRELLNSRHTGPRPLHALHGSDNAYETQHMIEVLWADDAERINNELLTLIETEHRSQSAAREAA